MTNKLKLIVWALLTTILVSTVLLVSRAFGDYDFVGTIHILTGNTDQGLTLTLDDGSTWHVCHGDEQYSKDWATNVEVIVVKQDDNTCGYQLLANHETADADYRGKR